MSGVEVRGSSSARGQSWDHVPGSRSGGQGRGQSCGQGPGQGRGRGQDKGQGRGRVQDWGRVKVRWSREGV